MADPKAAFEGNPEEARLVRPDPRGGRPALRPQGGEARERGRGAELRARPLRAAHARDGHRSSSTAIGSSSRASGSATTPGGRATGRRSTPTSGSRSTSVRTSARWCPSSSATRPASNAPPAACWYAAWRWSALVDATIEADYEENGLYHKRVTARVETEQGERLTITGDVTSFIPLRNRRGESVTHIGEGMTKWKLGDRTGYGLSEFLRQVK